MIPLHFFQVLQMPQPTSPRPRPPLTSTDQMLRHWGFEIVARPQGQEAVWRAASGEMLREADAVRVARSMARIDEERR